MCDFFLEQFTQDLDEAYSDYAIFSGRDILNHQYVFRIESYKTRKTKEVRVDVFDFSRNPLEFVKQIEYEVEHFDDTENQSETIEKSLPFKKCEHCNGVSQKDAEFCLFCGMSF